MTYEKQDILDSFYSGNTKIIQVKVWTPNPVTKIDELKNLTGSEITYVMMDRADYTKVKIRKSSHNGESEIKILGLGLFEVYLKPADSINLYGKFRHHINIVDIDNKEATILTGLVEIHRTLASRYREISKPVYLEGRQA